MKFIKSFNQLALLLFVFTFVFINCEDETVNPFDPTCDITCENDGVFDNIDCTCDCKEGYEGDLCEKEIMPALIRITTVEVLEWPQLNDGSLWDPLFNDEKSRPDPFLRFWHIVNGGKVELDRTGRKVNPDYNSVLKYTPPGGIRIDYPTDTYRISLYDNDSNPPSEEFMGNVTFIPWDELEGKKFPASFELTNSSGTLKFKVSVVYQH